MLGKGLKRKREEDPAWGAGLVPDSEGSPDPAATPPPSSSLFDLSVLKLHHSLRRGEPDLRHLVLVVNTLRRLQDAMGAEPAQPPPPEPPAPLPPPPEPPVSGPDSPLCTSIAALLDDLSHIEGLSDAPSSPSVPPPEDDPLAGPPEPGLDTDRPPSLGPLELLGPAAAGYLLEDGLEGLFEDIDTSMYDCELWPGGLKAGPDPIETVGKAEGPGLDMSELDYLMDVLVSTQTL
ncbi:SERTA domain-containing protein 1 [Tachyglossus aculeatus]|uniref:SERTA domain-containing protein 1 n=1 Tax=Tachyglossus aculeatus TaxID=9261 RepID=UPI0018F36D91|nr:SERTA domain-containing protein 1 [Tachyglossus aculeatus]